MTDHASIMTAVYVPSGRHARMSAEMRAAQFASFAALTGYDEMVEESERLTERRCALFDDEILELNRSLRSLADGGKGQLVTVLYFQPDAFKAGGEYKTKTGIVKKVDEVNGLLIFEDRETVRIEDIVEIA